MARIGILTLAFSAALLPLACSSSSTTATPTPKGSTVAVASSAVPNVQGKIEDAAEAAKKAAEVKRDEFAAAMQKQLDELDVKYRDLEKSAAAAQGDAKTKLDEKVKVAKAKRDALATKLDVLKKSSHDRWEKVKDGVSDAYDDLKSIFK